MIEPWPPRCARLLVIAVVAVAMAMTTAAGAHAGRVTEREAIAQAIHARQMEGTVIAQRFHLQQHLPKARHRAAVTAFLQSNAAEATVAAARAPLFPAAFKSQVEGVHELKPISDGDQITGEGSFGTVFTAKDAATGDRVAIKLVGKAVTADNTRPFVGAGHPPNKPLNTDFIPANAMASFYVEFDAYRQLKKHHATTMARLAHAKTQLLTAQRGSNAHPQLYTRIAAIEREEKDQMRGFSRVVTYLGVIIAPSADEWNPDLFQAYSFDHAPALTADDAPRVRGLWMEFCSDGDGYTARGLGYPLCPRMVDRHVMLLDVSRAVLGFHNAGLIHRDLKIENVFFCESGVKLGDLGLVHPDTERIKDIAAAPGDIRYYEGTPAIAPPEGLDGGRVLGGFDVWAIGRLFDDVLAMPSAVMESGLADVADREWMNRMNHAFSLQQPTERHNEYIKAYTENVKSCELIVKEKLPSFHIHPDWIVALRDSMSRCDVWADHPLGLRPTMKMVVETMVQSMEHAKPPTGGNVAGVSASSSSSHVTGGAATLPHTPPAPPANMDDKKENGVPEPLPRRRSSVGAGAELVRRKSFDKGVDTNTHHKHDNKNKNGGGGVSDKIALAPSAHDDSALLNGHIRGAGPVNNWGKHSPARTKNKNKHKSGPPTVGRENGGANNFVAVNAPK